MELFNGFGGLSVIGSAGALRRALRPLGVRCSLSIACCLLSAAVSAADWPVFRGNNERTGFTAEQAYPVPAPAKVWDFDVQGDVVASPVVYGGIVYAAARSGNIYALNALTGELIWDYSTDDWVDASPAVSSGTVYVPSRDGHLYALDRLNGHVLWSAGLGASSISSPLVLNGKVYVGVGAPQNMLKAFDAASGAFLWQYSAQLPQPVDSSPSTDGAAVYFGSNDGHIYALNKDSGAAAWTVSGTQQTVGSFGMSAVPVSGGSVYALPGHDERKLLRFSAADGSQAAATQPFAQLVGQASENEVSSPVISPYGVFAGAGSQPHRLYAFDPVSLDDIVFSSPSAGSTAGFGALSSPAMANEVMYLGTVDARLIAVSSAGAVLWQTALSSSSYSSPAVSNGFIYTGTMGGRISAYKAALITSISSPRPYEVVDATVSVYGYIKNPNLAGYELEYGTGENPSSWTFISSSPASSEISGALLGPWNTSLLANGLYTLRLTTVESAPSGTLAEARLTARVSHIPQPPSNFTAADEPGDSGNKVRLNWTASPSAWVNAYRVYRGPYGGAISYLAQISTPSVTYLDAAAPTGSVFTYFVKAFDGYTESSASGQASASSLSNDPSSDASSPSAPAGLSAVPGMSGGSADLSWTAPGNDGDIGSASGYEIRYSTVSPFSWSSASVWKSNRPVSGPCGTLETETVTGLFGGVTYYFSLKAYDLKPNYSAAPPAVPVAATVDLVPPGAPSAFTVTDAPGDHGGSLTLNWALSPDDGAGARDVYGYKIYRSESSGLQASGVPYASVGAGYGVYTDTSAPDNIKFYYAVTAFDSTHNSAMTAEASGISADNWRFFDASNGGTVRLADGTEVDISENAVTQNDNIMVIRLDPVSYRPMFSAKANTDARPTPVVYEIKFENSSTKLVKPAVVNLAYTDAEVSGMQVENLRMYTLSGGTWMLINTSKVVSARNLVTAEVSHFSLFRIMEYLPSGALISADAVYTYPNPAKGDTLTFKFLVRDKSRVTVDVFNVAGEKVAQLEKVNCPAGLTSEIIWPIGSIASGVYVYRVSAESASGSRTVTKKLAIIH